MLICLFVLAFGFLCVVFNLKKINKCVLVHFFLSCFIFEKKKKENPKKIFLVWFCKLEIFEWSLVHIGFDENIHYMLIYVCFLWSLLVLECVFFDKYVSFCTHSWISKFWSLPP